MGGYECYCAICAGPMDQKDIGDDEYSYNPEVLQPEDIEWLSQCHVLGVNDDTEEAYISGPGVYTDHGAMMCEPGDDPNCEDVDFGDFRCYDTLVPFHWDCYRLLCRRITGSDDTNQLKKDVLFRAIEPLMEDYEPVLKEINYTQDMVGIDFCTGEQAWEVTYGEEFFVCSPLQTPELSSGVQAELNRTFAMPPLDSTLSSKAGSDPFAKLPQEVTNHVLSYLDKDGLMNFLQASWAVHSGSHSNKGFWKVMIREHMPWFFELHEFLQGEDASRIESVKAVYLWAQENTKARQGIRGPLMKISNRRRIWHVCNRLAGRYLAELSKAE